ncbi:MAG: 2-amino-4-hydroxy-6-hydroxymethyldihydropteridine diphosphokinase [Syntrophobacteraceae bacterium]|nr:2-amino-4-hydroxy-6-hydroxymethyldihydropteridine diphosphokinase [Syntrophobacteraceae bacterium]
MEKVLIGFGSNEGEPLKTCLEAVERLRVLHPLFHLTRVSPLYRTKPVGPVEQDWFVNGVILGETSLGPHELFSLLQELERDFGRVRGVRWGPRTLDLDILAHGNRVVRLPHLTIPHPRLHERLFVLAPLADIDPSWVHPVLKVSAAVMLANLLASAHHQEIEHLDTQTP